MDLAFDETISSQFYVFAYCAMYGVFISLINVMVSFKLLIFIKCSQIFYQDVFNELPP